MDLDRDTQLEREERASPGKRLGAMSYSCMGSSHCMSRGFSFSVVVKATTVFPHKDLKNIILYAYGRLRKDIDIYQNILHVN
jgi:hypothetical protein